MGECRGVMWKQGSWQLSPLTVDGAGCRVCAVCALRAAAIPRKKHTEYTNTHTHSPKDTKLAKRASSSNNNSISSRSSKKMGEKEKFQLRAVAFNWIFSSAAAVAAAADAAASNWSLWWTNARPAHPHPSGASAANSAFHFAETRLVSKCYTARQLHSYTATLAAGSFLVILKAPSRKSLSGLFSFTLICSCKRCPSVRLSSFLVLSHSLSSFLCRSFVTLRFVSFRFVFFLICCKFLIKKFRFNAAIDCTFCRHHHNNLLTHLALSALATLHLFRLNFSYLLKVLSYEI